MYVTIFIFNIETYDTGKELPLGSDNTEWEHTFLREKDADALTPHIL